MMANKVLQFEISSPAQLQEALADGASSKDAQFAAVRVFGPSVLTRQFNFPKTSARDLIAGLKHEASETLTVKAEDLEISCQVTGTDEQGVHGIYSAMPSQLLDEYFGCFEKNPLIPVSLKASAVGAVVDFLEDQVLPEDNFCLVNFLKSHAVNIIIFANAKPIFFRELYDLSDSDYEEKIKDTIRYSCSQSASKSINHIFFIGDTTGKADLIKNLKKIENSSRAKPVSAEKGLLVLSNLDLFGKFTCGLAERARLISIFTFVFVISVLLCMILCWNYVNGNAKLRAENSLINMNDYHRALDLQDQVRRLNHA